MPIPVRGMLTARHAPQLGQMQRDGSSMMPGFQAAPTGQPLAQAFDANMHIPGIRPMGLSEAVLRQQVAAHYQLVMQVMMQRHVELQMEMQMQMPALVHTQMTMLSNMQQYFIQ